MQRGDGASCHPFSHHCIGDGHNAAGKPRHSSFFVLLCELAAEKVLVWCWSHGSASNTDQLSWPVQSGVHDVSSLRMVELPSPVQCTLPWEPTGTIVSEPEALVFQKFPNVSDHISFLLTPPILCVHYKARPLAFHRAWFKNKYVHNCTCRLCNSMHN